MVRLLIEDVTLIKGTEITMHIRFRGGAIRTLGVPAPMNSWQLRKTSKEVISQIDRLLDRYTDVKIADILRRFNKSKRL